MMSPTIHPADEPTNGRVMAPTTTIDRPSTARSGVRVGRRACEWLITPTRRPSSTMSIDSPWPMRWHAPTNGRATIISSARMRRFATARRSARVTTTAMVSARCMSTRPKVCGPQCAILGVLSVAFTRSTSAAKSLCASSASISRELHCLSSQPWSPCTRSWHEPTVQSVSPDRPAAIHQQILASHEAARRTGEKDNRAFDFLRPA